MISLTGPRLSAVAQSMPGEQRNTLKEKLQARLSPDASGCITISARANAVTGRVPD
jgi:hypothetical protein